MPGANGFGYFPRKESNPRRGTARKKTWMSDNKDTGLQSPSMDFALRANLQLFKFVPDKFVLLSADDERF